MTNLPFSIPFPRQDPHHSNTPLYSKKDGFSWCGRHAANFQHCEVSAGRPMVFMVERFPPAWM